MLLPNGQKQYNSIFQQWWFDYHLSWCDNFYERIERAKNVQFYTALGKQGCICKVLRDDRGHKIRVFKLASLVEANILPKRGKIPSKYIIKRKYLKNDMEVIVPYVKQTYLKLVMKRRQLFLQ